MYPIKQMMTLACVVLLTAGCASQDVFRSSDDASRYAAILNDAELGPPERCLSSVQYDSVEVLNENRIMFTGIGDDDVWVNELKSRCPALETYDAVKLEKVSTRLCEFDEVAGIDRFFFSWQEGPSCLLGKFHKVDKPIREKLMEVGSR